jgi:excisionase family DNA binding protein
VAENIIVNIEWMTAAEAAQHLKIKQRTLLMWVRQGKLQAYALSGTKRRVWRFLRADLDNALLGNPVVHSPQGFRTHQETIQ